MPAIFVDLNGTPLPIFVESNGIADNRPKLIRSLRNNGANICVDVSLARIILVEPHSSEGRHFVRNWGMDPGKVILEVAWVRRCLDAGRALLENDAWGGCGNLDGTPLEDDVVDDEEQGLFTHSKAFGLNDRQAVSSTSAQPRTPNDSSSGDGHSFSVLPTPRPTPVIERGPSSTGALVVQNNGITSSQVLPTPPTTSTQAPLQTPSQSQHFPPNIPANMPSNVPPNMPPNMVPTFGQLVPQSQLPINAVTQQMFQSYLMNNPEAQQMVMNMMMQTMPRDGLFMASGWPGQPVQGFMQLPQGYSTMQLPQSQPPITIPAPGTNEQYVAPPLDTHEPSPVKAEPKSPLESMSPLPTFTTVDNYDSDSDSPSPNQSILLQRGKKRHREPHAPSSPKRTKRSKSPSVSQSKKHEKKHLSTDIATVRQQESSKRGSTLSTGIFSSRSREPMTFYIQVQLRNRKEFVRLVKEHGGKISADLPTADFIILDTRPGKERDQWMKVVKESKRFALRAGFIEACINSGGMVEEEDFIIEPSKKSKLKSSPRRKKREDSVETEERNTPSTSQSSRSRYAGSRSPSPPSESQLMSSGGRCSFTPEELSYAFKLAEHLCHKNPDISTNQIGLELAKRAPRHPAASWMSVLYRDNRSRLDHVRQDALNEKHNGPSNAAASGSELEVEAQLIQPPEPGTNTVPTGPQSGQSSGVPTDTNAHDSDADHSNLHETDLKTIVDFFANPPEGVIEDDALWAAISKMCTCHTAPTWQDFYATNQDVVNQRLREALDMPAEGIAMTAT